MAFNCLLIVFAKRIRAGPNGMRIWPNYTAYNSSPRQKRRGECGRLGAQILSFNGPLGVWFDWASDTVSRSHSLLGKFHGYSQLGILISTASAIVNNMILYGVLREYPKRKIMVR